MQIIFPHWYDNLYEFESEAKGYLLNFTIIVNHQEFHMNFYDSARFAQGRDQDEWVFLRF